MDENKKQTLLLEMILGMLIGSFLWVISKLDTIISLLSSGKPISH